MDRPDKNWPTRVIILDIHENTVKIVVETIDYGRYIYIYRFIFTDDAIIYCFAIVTIIPLNTCLLEWPLITCGG